MSEVRLLLYDLTNGMAKSLSSSLLGIEIEAVYHSSVVVHGKEYFFGGDGISSIHPYTTILGRPHQEIIYGYTQLSKEEIENALNNFQLMNFGPRDYDLIENNCNNFSNELLFMLVEKNLSDDIIELPKRVMKTPIGKMLLEMMSRNSPI